MFVKSLVVAALAAFGVADSALVGYWKECKAGDMCSSNFECVQFNPYHSQCDCPPKTEAKWVSSGLFQCMPIGGLEGSFDEAPIPYFGACRSVKGAGMTLGSTCQSPFVCVSSGEYYSQCRCPVGQRSQWMSGPPDVFSCVNI